MNTEPATVDTWDTVKELQAANDADLTALAQQGVVVGQDSLTHIRLMLLLDRMLGTDTDVRLEYELACQRQFVEALADVKSKVAAHRLLDGVHGAQLNGKLPPR